MRRVIALLLLLVATASVVSPQGRRSARWLNGTWEGTGYQIDTDETWTMRLSVGGGRYRIEYPSLTCGGRWRLLEITPARARFHEQISVGRDRCVNGGRVVIERLNGRQIAYRFSYRGTSEVSASAILKRTK